MSDFNLGTLLNRIASLPNTKLTSSSTTTPIDIADYVGDIQFEMSATSLAGSSPTLDIALRTGAASNAMAEVTGKTFTQVTNAISTQGMTVNTREVNKWIDFAYTLSGTGASFACAIIGHGIKQTQ